MMALPPLGSSPAEQSVNQFALLAQLLKKYPKLQVTLALHSAAGDYPVPYSIFAAQTATDLLRQEGVAAGRVAMLFAGSSYPIAEGDKADSPSKASRRAEVFLENPTLLPFGVYRPPLPTGAFRAQFFQKTMTSLAYRATVDGDGDLVKLFELYPDGLLEMGGKEAGFSFTPGLYLTHASASEWLAALVKDGFVGAKITAHLRGLELTREEAAKYVEDFPDLRFFAH